jgi:succinate-acetate transporter protein
MEGRRGGDLRSYRKSLSLYSGICEQALAINAYVGKKLIYCSIVLIKYNNCIAVQIFWYSCIIVLLNLNFNASNKYASFSRKVHLYLFSWIIFIIIPLVVMNKSPQLISKINGSLSFYFYYNLSQYYLANQ